MGGDIPNMFLPFRWTVKTLLIRLLHSGLYEYNPWTEMVSECRIQNASETSNT